MRVLVSRPTADAADTIAKLVARGHQAMLAPMLTIAPVAAAMPDGAFDAIAVTSANGARRLGELAWPVMHLPAFVVGARTGDALRAAGCAAVSEASGEVAMLATLIASRLPRGARVLWVAGEDRAGDLATMLAPSGIAVVTQVVYRAQPAIALPAEVVAALRSGAIDAALHYSRRTVETLLEVSSRHDLGDALLTRRHYALSETIAGPLRRRGASVAVAAQPTEAALLARLDDVGC